MATDADGSKGPAEKKTPRYGAPAKATSGFVIVRFRNGYLPDYSRTFIEAARKADRGSLLKEAGDLVQVVRPVVESVEPAALQRFESKARAALGDKFVSLSRFWRIDARKAATSLGELEAQVSRWPGVEDAYQEAGQGLPAANPMLAMQGYLAARSYGIDAHFAAQQLGGRGLGTTFVDIEYAWTLTHQDLPQNIPNLANDIYQNDADASGHGTSVLGIVAARDNNKGTLGIAADASVKVASWWNQALGTDMHVADAFAAAVTMLTKPHVVLLEVHLGSQCLPVESDPVMQAAMIAAVEQDIVVVQAAGTAQSPNVGIDLDLHHLQRAVVDTGTIMVGCATSGGANMRSSFSNYGTRVDCFAWGDSIVAPGVGGPFDRNPDKAYTQVFGGTSGAAAIIAGAALSIQGMRLAKNLNPLQPDALRALLSDKALGTKQSPDDSENIGAMPDLQAIFNSPATWA